MSADRSLLVRRDGAVGRLTLNRPDKRNALDDELIASLRNALRELDGDQAIRVIALAGAGKDFCAGADLSALQRIAEGSIEDNLADVDGLADLFLLPRELRKPVVALVHGRALAGGCGLATACDLVLATENARFGYPEVRLGFVPAMVTAILRRNIAEKQAFELIAVGDQLNATDAQRIGLINHVFPDDDFISRADEYLAALAERSASAVQLCKRLLYHQDGMDFRKAVRAGADLNIIARMTDDMQDGVARFLSRGR